MTSETQPLLFSVIIPAHRRPDLLAKCLGALESRVQTLSSGSYEVIVSDDSPPEESLEPLMVKQFPWVRWLRGPRKGPAANRNNGAAHARGEWLSFTDDDCIPDPGWLSAFGACIARNPRAEVMEGRTNTGGAFCGPFEAAPVNESGGFLWSCNLCIKRAVFRTIGGFDENFRFAHMEDVDLRWRLRERNTSICFARDALVVHPPRPLSSLRKDIRKNEANVYFAQKHGVSLGQAGLSAYVVLRTWLNRRRTCRGFSEVFQITLRDMCVALFVVVSLPTWLWRYRNACHWNKIE